MIHFVTIALDALPYLSFHIQMMNRLRVPWRWHIIEGTALPLKDTSWVTGIPPRLSEDGTTEYLQNLSSHPNVTIVQKPSWPGKTAMVNHALSFCHTPGLLWQLDADEIWQAQDIETIYNAFQSNPRKNCARFHARYFLGQNIIITSDNTYGNHFGEWVRCWRYFPGMKFKKHEPPVIMPMAENAFSVEQTLAMGVEFDHYAYATIDQVALKEKYYGYTGAVDQWLKLQQNTVWPCRAGKFLKWITDETICDRLYR